MRSIVLATLLAIPAAQTAAPSAAGLWTAQQGGLTFVRLEFSPAGNVLAGRISIGDIETDRSGAMKKAAAAPSPMTPIQDVKVTGSVVTFVHKDGTDLDHFRMNVLKNDTAELTFLPTDAERRELASSGTAVIKPITLTKAR